MIVPAVPADADAVRALVRAAFAPYEPRIGRAPAPMDADHPALIAAGHVWLLRRAGALAGVLVLVPAADHLLVDTVAVAPPAQGTGVGTALLAFAEAHAHRLGRPELRLYTNAAMRENLAFYPRRGFVETHRAVDEGFHRVFYAKRLA